MLFLFLTPSYAKIGSKWSQNRFSEGQDLKAPLLSMLIPEAPFGRVNCSFLFSYGQGRLNPNGERAHRAHTFF